ncbi:MAG: metalloregulator ArsR/SmtB family transcription factor [Myxococcota bacterium]
MSARNLPVLSRSLHDELDTAFFKALADPTRIAMVMKLATQNGLDVDAISAGFPQDRSVISRHLQILQTAGILERQPQGRHVIYRLNGTLVLERLEGLVATIRAAMASCCPPDAPVGKPRKSKR